VADGVTLRGMPPAPEADMTMEKHPHPVRINPEAEEEEPMEAGAYGASSSESGGNYDDEGPTTANIEGEPMDAREETSSDPSTS
jgi:hypothetical protein